MTGINRRRLRSSLGSRTVRRQSTKLNSNSFKSGKRPRPKTKMKQLLRGL